MSFLTSIGISFATECCFYDLVLNMIPSSGSINAALLYLPCQASYNYTMKWLQVLGLATTYISVVLSETIAQIQGNKFQSPLSDKIVTVTGVVTAMAPNRGFFLDDASSSDIKVSSGLHIYITTTTNIDVQVNRTVTLNGTVSEFRSNPNDLYATRIINSTIIAVGAPPPRQLTNLDVGLDGYLSIPNITYPASRVEVTNAELNPELNGLDFWESLEGQLVTIPKPIAAGLNKNTGFWVYGQDWNVTSKNSRGGLTITIGSNGKPDANPQAILIRKPLDANMSGAAKMPSVALGTALNDITGIVYYSYGHFSVLPLTAPVVKSFASGSVQPTNITSNFSSTMISFGNYNVNNLAPDESTRLSAIANHIVKYLKTPDIVFLQEIQDNSGPIDDGTVSGDITLANLVDAIAQVGSVTYASIEIAPINNEDGGKQGGNIRQAYLYRTDRLSPFPNGPAGTVVSGTADQSVAVDMTSNNKPKLNFNPGRIDPLNDVWKTSRKPLVAQWQTKPDNKILFTINVHMASKGKSSTSNWGDVRPPINGNVDQRKKQIGLVATFVQSILKVDPNANILVGGDFNEWSQAREVFKPLIDVPLTEAVPLGVPEVERYSYVFDQNCGALDHVFASKALVSCRTGVTFEHVHVNTWANATDTRISDHDPSVGLINLC
ncbi:hypothetical protein E4T56_gene16112 [Termitomyces sp. T112]|nr:hypothetical protein E4T56_gene16112 [Termitomyces sp. T112]